MELPNTEEIVRYVADFRDFLKDGTIPERKALIRNFVEGTEVVGRRGDADVYGPHAKRRGDVGVGS